MVDFTVAIRTYNGERLLPNVLDKLRCQVRTEEINWEIIVIDNNSNDGTAKVVAQYQSNWHYSYPLKYYFEPKQGASIARQRAIHEAQGSLIGFLDDDNLPDSDWVFQAYSFGKLHPNVGAYGGQIHGEFETVTPQNFQRIAVYLAIIERGKKPFCYNKHKQKVLPPGAGIVIAKQAWLETVPDNLVLLGPNKKSLSTKGEDLEILSYIQNGGWEIWYNPEMHIYHHIPAWRMERSYLISLSRNSGLTRHYIRMLRLKSWQRPFAFFAYLGNDLRKLILHIASNWTKLKTDTVAACETALLLSILVSPFHIWRSRLEEQFR
ncbi:MAG: hormogonium polysaccharide biosynthesis glycosyltransferase HpsE [Spirulinaceae cyanobacterium]